jgi:hypothetical protein
MNGYSRNIRIEPTPKGWLFLAQSALEAAEKRSDPKRSAELHRKAKDSIRRAFEAIEQK